MLPRAVMASTRPSTSKLSLTAPFTRNSLNLIRNILEEHHATQSEHVDPSEVHAAVLTPFCNVNDKPGVLLEVRGKLRTHSGEVRYAPLRSAMSVSGVLKALRMVLAFRVAESTRCGTARDIASSCHVLSTRHPSRRHGCRRMPPRLQPRSEKHTKRWASAPSRWRSSDALARRSCPSAG